MSNSDAPTYFVKPKHVQTQLALGKSHLDLLIRSGDLRTIKYGQRRLVPVDAVAELAQRITAGKVPSYTELLRRFTTEGAPRQRARSITAVRPNVAAVKPIAAPGNTTARRIET
jgi:hypothetical protein